jgi:4-amino-4-deoxy-L-arabinose transferase-like glycosyltransferase
MTAPKFQSALTESARLPAISPRIYWIALAIIVAIGAFLRFYPTAAMQERRGDELIYARSTEYLYQKGIAEYPNLSLRHIEQQLKMSVAMPPPTRFLYPFFGYVVRSCSSLDAHRSLVFTSALFTTFSLLLAAAFSYRLAGTGVSLGVAALMAVTMNQIQQAQHAMIDGFFATWALLALWSFWELLQRPDRRLWMALYAISLAAMVVTKENSFFVVVALGALLVANRWLKLGTVTPSLWVMTFLGPLVGFVSLIFLTGGLDVFMGIQKLQLAKIKQTEWAVNNGDGPWYRYLVDLTLVSPLVMLLAIGQTFQLRWREKGPWLLAAFVLITFAMMGNIKYGLSVRYTTIWDMPLRFLAILFVARFSMRAGQWSSWVFCAVAFSLALFELNQYSIFCVQFPSYALTDGELLQALKILK